MSPGTTSFQESTYCIDFTHSPTLLPTVASYTKEQPPFNILTLEVYFVVLIVTLQLERETRFLKPIIREKSRAMFVAVRHPVSAMINHVVSNYALQKKNSRWYKFLLITNSTHFFHVFVYFISLHVSSITVLIRRSNCINTSSAMISILSEVFRCWGLCHSTACSCRSASSWLLARICNEMRSTKYIKKSRWYIYGLHDRHSEMPPFFFNLLTFSRMVITATSAISLDTLSVIVQ